MKVELTEYQIANLKNDVRTLLSVSTMLEKEGRYKLLPSMLNSIASDILSIVQDGERRKEVVT